MGLFDKIRNKYSGIDNKLTDKEIEEISSCIDICNDTTCESFDDGNDGEYLKEEEMWESISKDTDSKLYGSAKKNDLQIIIPTNKTDWKHDALSESFLENSVPYQINKLIESLHSGGRGGGKGGRDEPTFKISANCSSLPIDNIMDIECVKLQKGDLLLLPYFIWIKNIRYDEIMIKFPRIIKLLEEKTMNNSMSKNDLLQEIQKIHADSEKCQQDGIIMLCSHTTRDKRCGKTAPILQKIYDTELQKHEDSLDRGKVMITFINHIGGHKFVSNCQIYLQQQQQQQKHVDSESLVPQRLFLWLARVSPRDVPVIVSKIIVPYLTGSSKPQFNEPEKVRCIKKFQW